MNSKDRTYICPACVVNEKTNGLICSDCQDEHKRISMSAIREHRPVETQLQYVLRTTEENLISLAEKLENLKNQTSFYFNEAYREVSKESKGIRVEKEDFIGLVKERYQEIMMKSGLEKQAKRIEWLKQTIRSLEEQKQWLKKIDHQNTKRKVAEYEKTAL